MQRLLYISNSRDFSEQGNINENKYFVEINEYLANGWMLETLTVNASNIINTEKPGQQESFAAFALLKKNDES